MGGNTRHEVPPPTSTVIIQSSNHGASLRRPQLCHLQPKLLNMPLFGGYCDQCGESVYFWITSLGGHNIPSASLVLHPEQPYRGGIINSIHDIAELTGITVYGLPARRRIERHNAHPGVHRVRESISLYNGETIDLTQDSSGEEERNEGTGEEILYEGRNTP